MNKMKRIGREKVELGVTETTMHISTHHIGTDTFLSWVHSKKIGFVIKFVDAERYFTQLYSSQTFLPDKVFFTSLQNSYLRPVYPPLLFHAFSYFWSVLIYAVEFS